MCNYKLMWKTFKHFWKTFASDGPKERPWSGDYLLFPCLMIQSSEFKPFPDLDTRPGSFHLKTLIKWYQYIDTLLTTMLPCSYILISDTNIFIPILIVMYLSRQLSETFSRRKLYLIEIYLIPRIYYFRNSM